MAKRLRAPKARVGELVARWGKVEGEIDLCYDGPTRPDMHLLHNALTGKRGRPTISGGFEWDDSFVEELKARGYDITTLRFSVRKMSASQ